MGFNASLFTIEAEEIYDLDKSGESTETLDTAELSQYSQDPFDEYKEMVDNFNNRMLPDSHQQNHGRNIPTNERQTNSIKLQSTLPPDILKYKAEIWYPECRDCGCCRGFKHGCLCAPSNNGICMCVTGVSDDVSVMTMNSYDLWYQQLQCQTQANPIVMRRSKRKIYSDNRREKVNAACRFFFSAAGCRHGDSCPFSHTK